MTARIVPADARGVQQNKRQGCTLFRRVAVGAATPVHPGRASRIIMVPPAREEAAAATEKQAGWRPCHPACGSTEDQAGRFIWHVVGVLEMYDSKVFSIVQVLPVFSMSIGFFASTLFHVARYSGCW